MRENQSSIAGKVIRDMIAHVTKRNAFAFLFRIATPLLHRQQSPNVCPIQIVYELVHF